MVLSTVYETFGNFPSVQLARATLQYHQQCMVFLLDLDHSTLSVVHTKCLSLINSMTTQLSNKKLTNGIAGSGSATAASSDGSSVIGGGGGGDLTSQNQSEHWENNEDNL